MLVNMMIFPQSVSALEESVPWQVKIDDEVYESPIYENGKRLIYIDRVNIPKETVSKYLLKNYKYSVDVYENQARYEAEIVPAVTARVVAELGETAAYSTQAQFELTGERMSAVDLALSEDYDNYIMAKRSATKDLYIASNESFLEDNIENEEDIVYQGKYTSSFILYATDEEIEKYAKCADVESISPFYNDVQTVSSIPEEQTQIGVDSTFGTKSSQYNSGNGYKGTGVKIGIIEAANGKFDSNAPQLSSISGGRLKYLGNVNNSTETNTDPEAPDHATCVTSLIVGQEYTVDGCTYEGVVPLATAYQIGIDTIGDVLQAVDDLIDLGVSVINYSGGSEFLSSDYYAGFDGKIDDYIETSGITFVVSAGNEFGSVTSPAMAYNAITVGNLHTKRYRKGDGTWQDLNDRYYNNFEVNLSSSYIEDENLANKPDVVAPGTGIEVPLSSSYVDNLIGTSFSAPLVTGIVAELHQAKPFLRINHTATKAIIIAGASHEYVYDSSSDTAIVNNIFLREKSGAGLVNAKKSMEIALSNLYTTEQFPVGSYTTNIPDIDPCGEFTALSGKKVRLVMTFSKLGATEVPSTGLVDNVNFAVYNYNTDELVAWNSDAYNNVEIVEFEVAQTTPFYIVAYMPDFTPRNNGDYLTVSFACIMTG